MHRKLIEFLSALHGGLLILMFLFCISSAVFPGQSTFLYRCALILIPVFVSSYGIHHLKGLGVYLLLCVCFSVGFFFLGQHLFEKLWLTIACILVFMIRIPARLNDTPDILDSANPYAMMVYLLVFISGLCLKFDSFCTISMRLAFPDLVLILIIINLTKLDEFLKQNEHAANLPGQQIVKTNRVMMSIFLAVSAAAMAVLPASGISGLMALIGDALWRLIRFLFSLLPNHETPEAIVETTEAVMESQVGDNGFPAAQPAPAWLTALLNGLAYVMSIALLLGLLVGLVFLIIRLFQQFYRPIENPADRQEFIHDDKTKTETIRSAKKSEESSLLQRFRPDAGIRRTYRKLLKQRLKRQAGLPDSASDTPGTSDSANAAGVQPGFAPASDTPAQLEHRAGLAADSSRKSIHELYEKARYSNEECTKEDLAAMKEAAGRIH